MDLLSGFTSSRCRGESVDFFTAVGGAGPPLLLVHGYPETHLAWSKIAPLLAQRFTVVLVDLPGYGRSGAPPIDEQASAYSKRATASELRALMSQLGFERFRVAGHDRGARVSYRMALDWPEHVERLAVLAILPTFAMWRKLADTRYAMQAFRWFLLAQPEPLATDLLSAAGASYVRRTLAEWTRDKTLDCFSEPALREYERAFTSRGTVAAACADYRAGWTLDNAHDREDLSRGARIRCPTLVLWGRFEFEGAAEMAAAWRAIAPGAHVQDLPCGHFLMEEEPALTSRQLLDFFA